MKEGAPGQEPQWPLKAGDGPQLTIGKETGTLVSQPQGTEFTSNLTEQETDLPRPARKECNLPTRWFSPGEARAGLLTYRTGDEKSMLLPLLGVWSFVMGAMENEHNFYQLFSAESAQTKSNTALPQRMMELWPCKLIIN